MSTISLIKNSGIQFIDKKMILEEKSPVHKIRTELYIEHQQNASGETELGMVLPEYKKDEGIYIDPNTNSTINESDILILKFRQAIESFEGMWIPIPYFRKSTYDETFHEGPIAWARMWFGAVVQSDQQAYNVVLAFDTKCLSLQEIKASSEAYITPMPDDINGSVFEIAAEPADGAPLSLSDWCQEWLRQCVTDRAHRAGLRLEGETPEETQVRATYIAIALYLTLIKGFKTAGVFPPVTLHESETSIEVDLILDIGNSRSCGLLMETARPQQPISFANCSRLALRDLTLPDRIYDQPFEMHCEFMEAEFGKESAARLSGYKGAFEWPGLMRVGPEAVRMSIINSNNTYVTGMSSPKRYLWDDTERREMAWHFNHPQARLALNEFSTIFTEEGKLGDVSAIEAKYPRASLMTFALVEIFLHAQVQINSYHFRKHHGQEHLPRKLKRVVLTCPIAMLLTEKYRLREYAMSAIKALRMDDVEIVPNPNFIRPEKLDDDSDVVQTDWGYDEATCVQLAFLYGEIHERFLKDANLFFKSLGQSETVRIASLDIGGGTTDLMICAHQQEPQANSTVLTPIPEFWEGFNLAGDDILRAVIEKIVLPGIKLKLEEEIGQAADLMNLLFGQDHGGQSAHAKVIRKQFANQIASPIALGMLEHVKENRSTTQKTFDEFFINHPTPHANVVDYIEQQCQQAGASHFRLRDLTWTLNSNEINQVIEHTLQTMLGNLSTIIAQYHCDYLLLAGQPSTLPVVRDIFMKFLPLPPDRIVPLGNYQIGAWYPFANARGTITDPKTCVSVGAAIGLMGGTLGRLMGFRVNTDTLRDKIKSTAHFIGVYDEKRASIKAQNILTFSNDEAEIIFHTPVFLGMRQLEAEQWRATPMYYLGYANLEVAAELARKTPFKMVLRRHSRNRELISRIESVERVEDGQKLNPNHFTIKLQTLVEEQGHWLDTGTFLVSHF